MSHEQIPIRPAKRCALSTLLGLGLGLLALGCDATTELDRDEPAPPELAQTITIGGASGPFTKSSTVNWASAGQPSQGFSGDFARAQFLMASLADASYSSGDDLRTQVEALGFNISKVIQGANGGLAAEDVDAFAGHSSQNEMNVIGIRGSSVVDDYLTDGFDIPTLNVAGWPTSFTLHAGFANYSNKVVSELQSAVADSCTGPRKPLWITGHSLGGAAATIVAYKLLEQGCNVAGVSTFGSPRAGLSDWQQAYEQIGLSQITQRWVYKQDPLTCLPFGGGWRQVGTLNRLDGGVQLNVQESSEVCNPQGLLGGLKTATAVADFPVAVVGAVNDWLKDLFELVLFCSNDTKWDDVISLGTCTVLENGTRVLQAYHFTPEEFLLAVISVAVKKADHDPGNYVSGMGNVDFPDAPVVPVATVHVVLKGPPAILQQMIDRTIPIIESQQHSLCVAERAPNGEVFCDFRVADGYTAMIQINTNDMLSLSPPQDFEYGNGGGGPTGCTRVDEFPGGSALITCERDIHGDTTIVVTLFNHVELT